MAASCSGEMKVYRSLFDGRTIRSRVTELGARPWYKHETPFFRGLE